jgi:ADP-heptose:LPS heptosyltransferase
LAGRSDKILLIQGPADEAMVHEVLTGLGGIPFLLVRDLPITRLAAVLSHACLVIGNDSGISHLTAALGVPTLAIFGPTDPCCWAPRSDRAFWLQSQAACAPCSREQLRSCEKQQCLEGITIEQVMAFIADKEMISDTTASHERGAIPRPPNVLQHGEAGISVPPP